MRSSAWRITGLPLSQLETIQAVIAGPPEHVAAALGRYIAAGARHLALRIAAPSLRAQREQLERIAGIFPVLRAGELAAYPPVTGCAARACWRAACRASKAW